MLVLKYWNGSPFLTNSHNPFYMHVKSMESCWSYCTMVSSLIAMYTASILMPLSPHPPKISWFVNIFQWIQVSSLLVLLLSSNYNRFLNLICYVFGSDWKGSDYLPKLLYNITDVKSEGVSNFILPFCLHQNQPCPYFAAVLYPVLQLQLCSLYIDRQWHHSYS